MNNAHSAENGLPMSAAEGDAWDELWDTDAAHCCSCPSCNFYAPDYEQHKDEPCRLRTLIERIIAARLAPVEALCAKWEAWGEYAQINYGENGDTQHAKLLRAALSTTVIPPEGSDRV